MLDNYGNKDRETEKEVLKLLHNRGIHVKKFSKIFHMSDPLYCVVASEVFDQSLCGTSHKQHYQLVPQFMGAISSSDFAKKRRGPVSCFRTSALSKNRS